MSAVRCHGDRMIDTRRHIYWSVEESWSDGFRSFDGVSAIR
jgi:hypothetical protein